MTTFDVYNTILLGYDLPDITDVVARPAWMADAACREHPELSWFPARGEDTSILVAVCRMCLVVEECNAFALQFTVTDLAGVWGGMSGAERRRVARRDRAA